MLKTPACVVLGKSYLAEPDVEGAAKWRGLWYKLSVRLFPKRDLDHKQFLEELQQDHDKRIREYTGRGFQTSLYCPISPFSVEGVADGSIIVRFKARTSPDIYEEKTKVEGEKKQVERGSIVRACFIVRDRTREQGLGVKMNIFYDLIQVEVLHRPPKKSWFKKLGIKEKKVGAHDKHDTSGSTESST